MKSYIYRYANGHAEQGFGLCVAASPQQLFHAVDEELDPFACVFREVKAPIAMSIGVRQDNALDWADPLDASNGPDPEIALSIEVAEDEPPFVSGVARTLASETDGWFRFIGNSLEPVIECVPEPAKYLDLQDPRLTWSEEEVARVKEWRNDSKLLA